MQHMLQKVMGQKILFMVKEGKSLALLMDQKLNEFVYRLPWQPATLQALLQTLQ